MIQDVVQAIVKSLTVPYSFYHAEMMYANAALDRAGDLNDYLTQMDEAAVRWLTDSPYFPMVLLDDDLENNQMFPRKSGRLVEQWYVQVYFMGKSDFDWDYSQRLPNLQAHLLIAREFITRLRHSDLVDGTADDPVNNIFFKTFYNLFDVNVDGVYIRCNIRLSDKGMNYCFTPTSQSIASFVLGTEDGQLLGI